MGGIPSASDRRHVVSMGERRAALPIPRSGGAAARWGLARSRQSVTTGFRRSVAGQMMGGSCAADEARRMSSRQLQPHNRL